MSSTRLSNLRHAMGATPWAITEAKLQEILAVVDFHAAGGAYTPDQLQAIRAATEARAVRAQSLSPEGGKIAVVPMYGAISQRSSMFSAMSGGCSTEEIGAALDQAMADPQVGAIVIDCDSPGGSVSGVTELATRLHGMRGQGKQIIAVANGLMASAAYWICSAADEIVVTPSGDVGSIGVFGVHTDISQADAKEGIKRSLIKAGKFKAEGVPFEPLSDEARAALQANVDDLYEMFTADVARNRGTTPDAVRSGYGEGRCLTAKRALAAGLVDRIDTLESVLAGLGAPRMGLSGRAARADAPALPVAAGPVDVGDAWDQLAAQNAARDSGQRSLVDAAAVLVRAAGQRTIEIITTTDRTTAGTPPDADDGASATISPPPVTEHTMSHNAGAAPAGAEHNATSAVAAERERAREIRALGREHNIDAAAIDEIVESGASADAAGRQILAIQRAARGAAPAIRVGQTREALAPWKSFDEQLGAVIAAQTPGRNEAVDVRLFGAASGMNQQVPSEGGFLVAPQFSQAIWDGLQQADDSLLGMTDNYTVEGESLTFNANAETSRATGSRFGGVRGYWINEADQLTKSKPKFRPLRLEPQQLGVLVYMTEKLMRNAGVALSQYVTKAAGEEINFLVGDAIYRGTGAGQPQGLMNSGSLITVPKETGQANTTVVQENVVKMWARMHPRARKTAVWLANVDVEPQLDLMNSTVKTVAGTENVGGYQNKVWDAEKRTLKGRPVIACEYSETLGTKGDLMLVDLGSYATGTRGGVESAVSMHVRFEFAEQALRFLFEVDGQNWLADPLTPYKGSNTLSTAVVLASRP